MKATSHKARKWLPSCYSQYLHINITAASLVWSLVACIRVERAATKKLAKVIADASKAKRSKFCSSFV